MKELGKLSIKTEKIKTGHYMVSISNQTLFGMKFGYEGSYRAKNGVTLVSNFNSPDFKRVKTSNPLDYDKETYICWLYNTKKEFKRGKGCFLIKDEKELRLLEEAVEAYNKSSEGWVMWEIFSYMRSLV